MYMFEVRAWKDNAGNALPMACNTEDDACAMFAHVLRADSEYDHATLCERNGPTSQYFTLRETGHRVGTVAAGLVAGTVNHAMIAVADQCYADMMAANAADLHEEYDRCDRVLRAALVMLTNGDTAYANALSWSLTDSGANVGHYLTTCSRNDLCLDAGEMSQEEYDATLRFAVECEEHGDTWTEAFATREQAETRAAELVANTTVVDREAVNAS